MGKKIVYAPFILILLILTYCALFCTVLWPSKDVAAAISFHDGCDQVQEVASTLKCQNALERRANDVSEKDACFCSLDCGFAWNYRNRGRWLGLRCFERLCHFFKVRQINRYFLSFVTCETLSTIANYCTRDKLSRTKQWKSQQRWKKVHWPETASVSVGLLNL